MSENVRLKKWLLWVVTIILYLYAWQSTFAQEPLPSEKLFEEHIIYNHDGPNIIGHMSITNRSSEINQSTWLYIKTALEHYKKSKPIFIILELDTPGGEVFAAQQISNALQEFDFQENIPVLAYINNWAISAGAMIAYSCRFIAVVKGGSMGAAEPVLADTTTGKMESASEKIRSVIRTDFANRASYFDRNPLIAEAMVDKDMIVVMRDHKISKLENESQIRLEGPEPDIVISPKGKLLTLNAEELLKYGVANLIIPPTKLAPLTPEEMQSGKWPADKLALFHQPFFNAIPNATVEAYQMDWKMLFFSFLMSPLISSLLFMGMTIGFYMEFSAPHFGIPGTVAVTCLFLILLSSFALEIGNWLELILLLTGFVIVLVELFVLPTFGLLGFIGALFFLMGLFGIMVPGIDSVDFEFSTFSLNPAGVAVVQRLAWFCASLLLSCIAIFFIARYAPYSKLSSFKRFVLEGHEQVGYIAGEAHKDLPQPGEEGEVFVTLRPSGKVIIQGNIYDALSIGPLIEKGEKVVVVNLDGSTIMVNTISKTGLS